MKKLVIGILLLGSFSSYASLNNVILKNLKNEKSESDSDTLKKALLKDLNRTSFVCLGKENSSSSASIKSELVELIKSSGLIVSIERDLKQPVILAEYETTKTDRTEIKFTTTSDFKKTLKVLINRYEIRQREIIGGTLIDPVTTVKKFKVSVLKIVCHIKR